MGPTPTPLVPVVQRAETLLGIASRYGIGLEALLVANPGIDPRLLSIGHELIIPDAGGEPVGALLPTPTPVSFGLSTVRCYRSPSAGLWCLTTAHNTHAAAIEGLAVLVTLLDGEGEVLAREPAYGPLNHLPQNGVMPLVAFFSESPPDPFTPVATSISAVMLDTAGDRYANLDLDQISSVPGSNGLRWRVQGQATLPDIQQAEAARISLLLIALDANRDAVGYSKWEAETTLEPGNSIPFDLSVFSLGPVIDHVDLLGEATLIH
jgi:LysM repeat protein